MNLTDPDGRCGEPAAFIGPRKPCPPTLQEREEPFLETLKQFLFTEDAEAKQAAIPGLIRKALGAVNVNSPVPATTDAINPVPPIPIPLKALLALATVDETGKAPEGYKGGRSYENDGREGTQLLPGTDANGDPIAYREWDVNPHQKGVDRGAERIVTGSDGHAY